MIETNLNGQTPDMAEENIEKMKTIFPDVFTEGKVDFVKLQQVLGNDIETSNERYNFTWNGKSKALRLSQTPSTGTLRPCKEDSKDWDTTKNLYIEGDNLEVLKLLQKSYHCKVKMIYIDPPYNTGKDFVYPDNFIDNIQNYKMITGQVDDEGKNISNNSETRGRYHTDWLNMMYPRLRLARNLLTDDGVIFISIDDNEVSNLRKLCDELFGEDNFIANIVWQKKYSPQNDAKYFSDMHDHILCYAKYKKQNDIDIGWERYLLPRTLEQNARYKNTDNDSRGPWKSSDFSVKTYSANYDYPVITPSGRIVNPPNGRCWRTSRENFAELVKDNRIWFGPNCDGVPAIKRFLTEVQDGRVPTTWWKREDVGDNQLAAQEILNVFNGKRPFDTPKPTTLIQLMLQLSTKNNDIILDFFSGSATTAHAVMQLNAEDGENRKFIMVQLPEPIDEKNEASKAEYKNICEIGKERIRRAGEKIKEEKGLEAMNLDIGFKVLKLDSSNIRKWQPDYDNFEFSLTDFVDNYLEGRTELDV
ncbi:MAG TPA: site-specific DNA-methyltransferase, partial [Clostridia bacterium]|nr:site-specific DNA-methyltransferase [Clostridia bacterium]